MSIPYRIVERSNPRDMSAKKKYYAQARVYRNINHASLCKSAAYGRSVIPSELIAAFEAVMVRALERLMDGDSVSLPSFGTFRVGVRSTGADTEAEFNDSLIRGAHIIFTPSKEIKKAINDCGVNKCGLEAVKRKPIEEGGGPGQGE